MINYEQGRISQLINIAKRECKVNDIRSINAKNKAQILCGALQLSVEELDTLLVCGSSILRTLNGHAFETVFDRILEYNGIISKEIGGDTEIDREVNGLTLQLKTPYKAGSTDKYVQYKTHKTHGAKSEQESLDYYSKVEHFADYLIGLISYEPLAIAFLPKADLPKHGKDNRYILSPFKFHIEKDKINRFDILGINNVKIPGGIFNGDNELLPKASKALNLNSEILIDTILNASNFRLWDMNIRGFAREFSFLAFLKRNNVVAFNPAIAGLPRPEKSDAALKTIDGTPVRFQVKGVTSKGCAFIEKNVKVDIETQLSRGRVNDHHTQSRLYLFSDFDYLIITVDPYYICNFTNHTYGVGTFEWRFYCIPKNELKPHGKYPHRIASHQFIKFTELEKYRIGIEWLNNWLKN